VTSRAAAIRRLSGRAARSGERGVLTGVLDVDGLDVHYGPVQALRGLSLRVEAGEMVALLGANGAGKTTTLRTISGLLSPSSGSVSFSGQRIGGLSPHQVVERGVVHVPEGRDLFPSLAVIDNLKAGYWVHRRDRSSFKAQVDRVMDYFPRLRERADQAAGTLSGGEQQMLVVARALVSSPRLLLIDELSFGLAPKIVQQLFEVLRKINADGTSILLVEQFVHMALANTHRAYVLAKGQIQAAGPSTDLARDPAILTAYLGGGAASPASRNGHNGHKSETRAARRAKSPTGPPNGP
jgi:branched-chain amino acid transport system ATP-binding protein